MPIKNRRTIFIRRQNICLCGGGAFPGAEARYFWWGGSAFCVTAPGGYIIMASNGRDFPAKVCPMAFSKCRRPRKGRNIAPGGQVFCLPSGAITYHQLRFILTAPSQGSWKCSVSTECEMTLSGKYKCTSAEKRMPLSPEKRKNWKCPAYAELRMPHLSIPHNARVPGTTSVISGTLRHYWLNKSGSDLLSHLVGQYHRRARA